jgi:hypothetical protein
LPEIKKTCSSNGDICIGDIIIENGYRNPAFTLDTDSIHEENDVLEHTVKYTGEGEGRENLAGTEWPDLDNIALPSVPENQNEIKTTNTHIISPIQISPFVTVTLSREFSFVNNSFILIFSCFFVLFSDDLGMLLYTCISIPPISFSMSELLPFLTIFPSLNTGLNAIFLYEQGQIHSLAGLQASKLNYHP